ncbi:MAG: hypothetical protein EPN22_07575 [Nitrospirae bacterium]|nr:MAG: hypothetical protein EPN22_07575 [Nitrospirota bacterium]
MRKRSGETMHTAKIAIVFFTAAFCLFSSPAFGAAESKKTAEAKPKAEKDDKAVKEISPEAKFETAETAFKRRDYVKSRQIFKELYLKGKDPVFLEKTLWGVIRSEYRLRHYFETKTGIKTLFSNFPRTRYIDDAYLLLGYMSIDLREYKEAAEYFKRIQGELGPKALLGEAELAILDDNVLRAETLLAGIGKNLYDRDPRALYIRAMILSRKGLHADAVKTFAKVLDDTLKEENLRVKQAEVLFKADKDREAAKRLEAIIAKPIFFSESVEAKKILFFIYEKEGKNEEASNLARELMSVDAPDDFKMRLISFFERTGNIDNAVKGLIYLKTKAKRYSEVERILKGAMGSKDNRTVEYLQKYASYLSPGSPFFIEAAKYLIDNGKKKEGGSLLNLAKKGSAKETAMLMQAEIYIGEDRDKEAAKMLEQLVENRDYSAQASLLLASIFVKKGEITRAVEYLTRSFRETKDSKTAIMLGDLYWKKDDPMSALKHYLFASKRGDGVASVKAGDCLYLIGKEKKAVTFYEKALKGGLKDASTKQWAEYQYGKLTNNSDYLRRAAKGGGEIGEAASMLLKE